MAVTYNAGTDTITVTGYTAGTPCTFLDIYNADVAGSWGQVTKQCNNQFCFDCKLVIGDASTATHFADTEKMVIFTATASHIRTIQVRTNANFRIGEIINAARRTSWKGCTIIGVAQANSTYIICSYPSETGAIRIYSSTLIDLGTNGGCTICHYTTDFHIWNTVCMGIQMWFAWSTSTCELYNTQFTKIGGVEGVILYPKEINVFDKVSMFESCGAALASGTAQEANFAIKNIYCRGNTYIWYVWGAWTKTGNFINVDSDTWSFRWLSCTGKIYRQYEFDLKVIDKDNAAINAATVKVWDKDSNLIVDTTTNASGVIATQTITRGYYNYANGNTLQESSPHLIKIEKAGYTTYEADFTLEDKTDWTIALQVGGGLMRNPPMTGGMV